MLIAPPLNVTSPTKSLPTESNAMSAASASTVVVPAIESVPESLTVPLAETSRSPASTLTPKSIAFWSTIVALFALIATAPTKSFATESSTTSNPVASIVVAPPTDSVPLFDTSPEDTSPEDTSPEDTSPEAVTFKSPVSETSPKVTAL